MAETVATRKRIDSLTDDERAQFGPWAQKWIEIGLNTAPADRPRFEAAVARCYAAAGLAAPKRIVWVRNPVEAVVAGPAAAFRFELLKRGAVGGAVGDAVAGAVRGAVDDAVRDAVRDAVDDAVRDAVRGAVDDAVDGAVRGAVDGAVRGAVGDAVDDAVRDAVRDAVGGAVRGAVDDAVDDAVDGAVRGAVDDAVGGAVRGAVDDAVGGAVRGAVDDAVDDAVDGAVRGAVDDAVGGAVRGAVDDAVGGAVRGAVDDAVGGAVRGAVRDAVGGAVRGAVRGAVDDAVDGAVRGAVGDAVGDAVDDAVRGAVDDAVDGAVRGAVDDAVGGAVGGAVGDAVGEKPGPNALVKGVLETISRARTYYMGGQFWVGYWYWGGARTSFFREVCGLQLEGDLWDRALAYEATMESANWWWPHREFVIVSERPHTINLERIAPEGWGSHRLHCEDGPAVAWEGLALYYWHGVHVPGDLIEHGWSTARILKEENSEVRRCAIERMGWDQFIADAALAQVGQAVDDPGNPGQTLALYDVPEQIYDEPVRVLLCTNGTVERDGTRRRFGLTVPASIKDPIAAAAWGYDLTAKQYATAQRRA